MERKGMQVIKDVASKTAGLVFFSLLAIALGVVFGVMFERWVGGGETGVPTATNGVEKPLEEVQLPTEEQPLEPGLTPVSTPGPTPVTTATKFRVRVGPYTDFAQASKAAEELRGQGYPIYLASQPPFLVQVGAFANKDNALSLKAELTQKGYSASVQPE